MNQNRNQDEEEEIECNTKPFCWLGTSFCCIGVLLTVILIPVSIKNINHEEYAQLTTDFITSGTHADITFLQLENYDFPDELSDAIFDKQRGEQDLDTANNEREGALTSAETALLLAEVDAEQRNIQAVAEGQKVILEAVWY